MRFLVDECTGPVVTADLRAQGHDVACVFETYRSTDDITVLKIAVGEDRILITADKGFGEKIYRQRLPHRGVILLRLTDQRPDIQKTILRRLLGRYAQELPNNFVVVNEKVVRFANQSSSQTPGL